MKDRIDKLVEKYKDESWELKQRLVEMDSNDPKRLVLAAHISTRLSIMDDLKELRGIINE